MRSPAFKNPFRPGAGHTPPYLAGRDEEIVEFDKLLEQDVILENVILTGLRGVGKTVLLERFRPMAISAGWGWVGTDLSESASVSENTLAVRLLTDLSLMTSSIVLETKTIRERIGFVGTESQTRKTLDYSTLVQLYENTPGLVADKLKQIFGIVWSLLEKSGSRGIIFAYDEAQNLSDNSKNDQYPLSILLDVFQSIQRKNVPFMLLLTGLPTLFPQLVEARTYAERMFRILFLDQLGRKDSEDAILKPIEDAQCPVTFSSESVDRICEISGGYPYFIQFICKEVYDVFISQSRSGKEQSVPVDAIIQKLDSDFFAGRWARATDRQRELLSVIAKLDNSASEFSVQEIVELSKVVLDKPFSSSHVNQMLVTLGQAGLVYKNRHGRYSLAVPLLDQFILRQLAKSYGHVPQ